MLTAPERLCETMTKIDAPTTFSDLAPPGDFYRDAVIHAHEIRDRFAFPDLAHEIDEADSGFFDGAVQP